MTNWLANHLSCLSLDEAHEGYFLGRGAKEESIRRLGVKSWQPFPEEVPNPDFVGRYGDLGEKLVGWMVWPQMSPRGRVIGFAGRRYGSKTITRFLLPEAAWQPIWTGLDPEVMTRIWQGADVWVVEGIFDLFPMEWAIKPTDVVLASETARLSYRHVEFLRRFGQGWVHMVYDNDEAGQHGLHGWVDENGQKRQGAITKLQRVGVLVQCVRYRGKDPGEIWSQAGAAGIRAAFQ